MYASRPRSGPTPHVHATFGCPPPPCEHRLQKLLASSPIRISFVSTTASYHEWVKTQVCESQLPWQNLPEPIAASRNQNRKTMASCSAPERGNLALAFAPAADQLTRRLSIRFCFGMSQNGGRSLCISSISRPRTAARTVEGCAAASPTAVTHGVTDSKTGDTG